MAHHMWCLLTSQVYRQIRQGSWCGWTCVDGSSAWRHCGKDVWPVHQRPPVQTGTELVAGPWTHR